MKLFLAALLVVSTSAFAGGEKKTYQTEKTNYGTRSDGKVVPTSKEVRKTSVKEKPQMEEAEDNADRVIIKEKRTRTYED